MVCFPALWGCRKGAWPTRIEHWCRRADAPTNKLDMVKERDGHELGVLSIALNERGTGATPQRFCQTQAESGHTSNRDSLQLQSACAWPRRTGTRKRACRTLTGPIEQSV